MHPGLLGPVQSVGLRAQLHACSRLHGTVAGVAWPSSPASHLMGTDARRALSPVARRLLRVRLGGARRAWRGAAVVWCGAALARGGRLRTQQEPGTLVQVYALPGRRHD